MTCLAAAGELGATLPYGKAYPHGGVDVKVQWQVVRLLHSFFHSIPCKAYPDGGVDVKVEGVPRHAAITLQGGAHIK